MSDTPLPPVPTPLATDLARCEVPLRTAAAKVLAASLRDRPA
ncbi:MAG TPA: hypothetical protein VIL30_07505 [Ramlibacter sp.]|jgi:hypothetical protein